jgi:hypothetical protein
MKRALIFLVAFTAMLVILGQGVAAANELDFDIANGHFFKQANGQGGGGQTGFAITDEGGIPFWREFRRLGGVSALGYPISQRFTYKGFTTQVTQKAVLQWQPATQEVVLGNVMDELNAAQKDEWLKVVKWVPPQQPWDEGGKSWAEVVRGRQAALDASPTIRAVYFGVTDPLTYYGLPTSLVEDLGLVQSLRTQRGVFQVWKVDTAWAKAGQLVMANVGDLAKEAGLFDQAVLAPEYPPGVAPPPTPTPVPSGRFWYEPQGSITYESNCGVTQMKIFVEDFHGNPMDDVTFRLRGVDGWTTTSIPTGWETNYPGRTDFVLDAAAKAGVWDVWAIDWQGNPVSNAVRVTTDATNCKPGEGGRQVATTRWRAPEYSQTAADGWSILDPATADQYQYASSGGLGWKPNCGMTQVKVYVKDAQGNPVDGSKFRIETDGWTADSGTSGSTHYGPGWTEFFLRNEPIGGNWRVWALGEGGSRASPVIQFTTNTGDCGDTDKGHQIAYVWFTKKY